MQEQAIVIHHIEGRRSFRVIWLCEELGIPYRLEFARGDIAGSLAKIRTSFPHMPVAPVVYDGTTFIVESGAILEVLTARHGQGRLAPTVDSPDYAMHQQWMHFAEGGAMARFVTELWTAMATGRTPSEMPKGWRAGVDPVMPEGPMPPIVGSAQVFAFIEHHLSHHPYFGGSRFSAADIMMQYVVRGAKLSVWIDPADYVSVRAWLEKVEARPAYSRAVSKACPGGMNEFMLPADQPLPFPAPPPRPTSN